MLNFLVPGRCYSIGAAANFTTLEISRLMANLEICRNQAKLCFADRNICLSGIHLSSVLSIPYSILNTFHLYLGTFLVKKAVFKARTVSTCFVALAIWFCAPTWGTEGLRRE